MRFAFFGINSLSTAAARLLIGRGHEVVFVDPDKEAIEALSEELDSGFIRGDGTKPDILREIGPEQTDLLLCLTSNDQANIIASLVGRSLGFKQVVTKIEDEAFEHICLELGLEDTIIPARTIGRYLADMAGGKDILELSSMIKDEARAFAFVVDEQHVGPVADLDLPETARVVAVYHNDQFVIPQPETKLAAGDEVVIITHRRDLETLHERWGPKRRDSR